MVAWARKQTDLTQEEEHELLTPETGRGVADGADTDIGLITEFKLGSTSYQSTAQIIVWTCISLTTVLVIFAATAVISSLASERKKTFHISTIMPSVNLASGPCEQLKYVNWTLHLLINSVATIIIACSNYMQQSNSPSCGHGVDSSLHESEFSRNQGRNEKVQRRAVRM